VKPASFHRAPSEPSGESEKMNSGEAGVEVVAVVVAAVAASSLALVVFAPQRRERVGPGSWAEEVVRP
jgi:hypothetical protein